jgi:uncharacterized glyoxalase superfamily protein PhnB
MEIAMSKPVNYIPEGFHTVTPYLTVRDAAAQIDFLKRAFDAVETETCRGPDGTIAHAEVRIGDSHIMIGQAQGEWKPRTATLYLYVKDADALYEQALRVGATSVMPMTDHFYGDRSGGVADANGNQWWVATHKEDVSPAEMERRMKQQRQ